MRKKIFDTTFGKLTVAYVVFGMIPLLFLSILFFFTIYGQHQRNNDTELCTDQRIFC